MPSSYHATGSRLQPACAEGPWTHLRASLGPLKHENLQRHSPQAEGPLARGSAGQHYPEGSAVLQTQAARSNVVGGRGRYKGSPPPGRWRDPRRAGSSAPQGQDPTSPGPTDPEGGCAEAQPVELGVFGSPTPTPRPISTLTRQTSQAWGPARTPESRPVLAAPSLWPDLPRAHTPWTEARPCLEASLQRADGRRMEVTGDRGLGQAPGLSSDTPSSLWMKEQNCSHLDPSKGPAVPMLTHTRTCRPELTRCPLEHAPPPPPPAALCRPWSPHTE